MDVLELCNDAMDHRLLNDWEAKFIADMQVRALVARQNGRELVVSEKQQAILDRIEVKIYA